MAPVIRARALAAVLGVTLFASGVVTGASVMRLLHARRMRQVLLSEPVAMRRTLVMRSLDTRLALDARQRAHALALLDAQAEGYRAALQLSRPRVQALRRAFARDLSTVLTEAQRRELDLLIREADATH